MVKGKESMLKKQIYILFLTFIFIFGLTGLASALHTANYAQVPLWAQGSSTTVYNWTVTNNVASTDKIRQVEFQAAAGYSVSSCNITLPAGWNIDTGAPVGICRYYTGAAVNYITPGNSIGFGMSLNIPAGTGTNYQWTLVSTDNATPANQVSSVNFDTSVDGTNPTITVDNATDGTNTITSFAGGDDYLQDQNVVVSVTSADAHSGLKNVTLYYLIGAASNVSAGTAVVMSTTGGGIYTGTIPNAAHSDGNVTHFVVVAYDNVDNSLTTADQFFEIDNIVDTVEANGAYTINEGQGVSLSSVGSADGDAGISTYAWAINGTSVSTVANPALTWNDLVTAGVADGDGAFWNVTLTITDALGNTGSDWANLTINNTNPVLVAGGNLVINEGSNITLNANYTDNGTVDTHVVFIDWGDLSNTTINGASSPITNTHQYADNGTFTVNITVTDDDGGSDWDSFTVTVNNVAPTVTVDYPNGAEIVKGTISINWTTTKAVTDTTTYQLNISNNNTATWTVQVAPGAADTGTYSWNTVTDGIADSAQYIVKLIVTDDDGTVATDVSNAVFTVDNTNPTAEANGPYTCTEGSTVGVVSNGSSDNIQISYIEWDLNNDAVYEINSTNTTFNCSLLDDAVYTIGVRVVDIAGNTATDTSTVTVQNVAPVVEAGTNQSINEGQYIVLASTFTDVGTNDTHVAVINWGDATSTNVNPATSPITNNHTYAENGSYTVNVTVTDDDAGTHWDTIVITVGNVAPSLSITNPSNNEYLKGTVSVDWTSKDNGTLDAVTFTVQYSGDAGATWTSFYTSVEGAPINGAFNTNWDTTAVTDGTYLLRVNATDDDGAQTLATVTGLTVDNTGSTTLSVEASPQEEFHINASIIFMATLNDANGIANATFIVMKNGVTVLSDNNVVAGDGVWGNTTEDVYIVKSFQGSGLTEGVYQWTIIGTDLSGNVQIYNATQGDASDNFRINNSAESPEYTNAQIDAMIAYLDAQVASVNSSLNALRNNVSVLETNVSTIVADIAVLDGNVSSLSTRILANDADILALQNNVTNLQTSISALDTRITSNDADILGLQNNVTALDTRINANLATITALVSANASLTSRLNTINASLVSLTSDVTTINNSVTTLIGNVTTLATSLGSVNASLTTLISNLNALLAYTITDTTADTWANTTGTISVNTSIAATCTYTNDMDSLTGNLVATGNTHSKSVTVSSEGVNVFTVTCTATQGGITYVKDKVVVFNVNTDSAYTLVVNFLSSGSSGWRMFYAPYTILNQAGLANYGLANVLTDANIAGNYNKLYHYYTASDTWLIYDSAMPVQSLTSFNQVDDDGLYWMHMNASLDTTKIRIS